MSIDIEVIAEKVADLNIPGMKWILIRQRQKPWGRLRRPQWMRKPRGIPWQTFPAKWRKERRDAE